MSDEDDSQERQHEATPRKREQAQEEGQVPRSRELTTMLVLVVGALMLLASGGNIINSFIVLMQQTFSLTGEQLFDSAQLLQILENVVSNVVWSLAPLLVVLFVVALFAPGLIGGWIFSNKLLAFKGTRLNPLAGIKRMFSLHSLVELVKSLLKFFLIVIVGLVALWTQFDKIISLSRMPLDQAVFTAFSLLAVTFLALAMTLVVIAMVDVPFQIWQHRKQSRMTTRELKEELKESEGDPEVKARVRTVQRRMAQKRMMEDVPKANVIITNPTHFAVALKYEEKVDHAPRVLAKGSGFVAEKIIALANEHRIAIYRAPPLARALFANTEIGQEIPEGLYLAVARILVYVYQLKRFRAGFGARPSLVKELPVPKELQVMEERK